MSRFHNDRGSEHLALGWHMLAASISCGELIFSLASAMVARRLAAFAAGRVPDAVVAGCFFWLALASAVIGFFCLAWHVRAVREHVIHLETLPKEKQ